MALEALLQEIEITIGRLLRIVWLIAWRRFIGALVLGVVIGFVIGFIVALAGGSQAYITLVSFPVGFALGLIWWVVVFKMALEKQYKDFRIALVAR